MISRKRVHLILPAKKKEFIYLKKTSSELQIYLLCSREDLSEASLPPFYFTKIKAKYMPVQNVRISNLWIKSRECGRTNTTMDLLSFVIIQILATGFVPTFFILFFISELVRLHRCPTTPNVCPLHVYDLECTSSNLSCSLWVMSGSSEAFTFFKRKENKWNLT